MDRTTIMLPQALKARASRRASKLRISLGEFIRRSVEALLRADTSLGGEDPLLNDEEVYSGAVPDSLSEDHDRHLYGPGAE